MTRKSIQILFKRRPAPQRIPITIRLPEEIVAQIDADLDQRTVPWSRNNWLLEAAVEKLQRSDRGRQKNGSQ